MIKKLTHPLALSVGGLGFLSAAAWSVALPLGLAAVGLSLLLLEWRIDK
jgi:hypothetical protein